MIYARCLRFLTAFFVTALFLNGPVIILDSACVCAQDDDGKDKKKEKEEEKKRKKQEKEEEALLKDEFKPGGSVTLPRLGVSFKRYKAADGMPIGPLNVNYVYRYSEEAQTLVGTRMYNGTSLWRLAQACGKWCTPHCHVSVAAMKYKAPVFPGVITYAEFEAWTEKPENAFSFSGNESDFTPWMTAFLGAPMSAYEPMSDTKAGKYAFKRGEDEYALVLVNKAKTQCVCFYFKFISMPDTMKGRMEKLMTDFVASAKLIPVSKAKSKLEKVKTTNPLHEESVSLIKMGVEALSDWRMIVSPHYMTLGSAKSDKLLKDSAELLEQQFPIYNSLFPFMGGEDSPASVCRVFNNIKEAKAYCDQVDIPDWAAGFWYPVIDELIVTKSARNEKEEKSRKINSMMFTTIRHEGWHQYLHYAVRQTPTHLWFNEGMAMFSEGFDNRGKFVENEDRLRGLRAGVLPIKAILNVTSAEWNSSKDESLVNKRYSTAWGLMYFLNCGSIAIKRPEYRAIPRIYFRTLCETRDKDKAQAAALKGIDLDRLQKDFDEFWRDSSAQKRAGRVDPVKDSLEYWTANPIVLPEKYGFVEPKPDSAVKDPKKPGNDGKKQKKAEKAA